MKAALWYGKRDVRIEDFLDFPPGEGNVKARVYWCGICGTDLHEYEAGPIMIRMDPHPLTGIKPPVVLGHEFSGEVVECGKGVSSLKPGDRIVTNTLYTCGVCYWCKRGLYPICEKLGGIGIASHGAFAEYIHVKADQCYVIPPQVPNDVAALVEPMAAAVHGIRRGRVLEGDTVAVIGAGPIGLMALQAARTAGASQLFAIEISEIRRKKAESYGAIALNPLTKGYATQLLDHSGGVGPDVVVECVGAPETGPMAVDLVRRGGRAVIMGVFSIPSRFNFNDLVFTEKEVVGSLCYIDEFETVLRLLADGRLSGEGLITGRIALDDLVEKGFEELIRNKEKHSKILVKPN
jgi:(R,R)-butanediol dehydrogenase/meso-butanediol dehydrogenase/diacetyl reductase